MLGDENTYERRHTEWFKYQIQKYLKLITLNNKLCSELSTKTETWLLCTKARTLKLQLSAYTFKLLYKQTQLLKHAMFLGQVIGV